MAAAHRAAIAPTLGQLHLPEAPSVAWVFQLADQLGEHIKVASLEKGTALKVGAVSQKYSDDMFALHFISPGLPNGYAVLGEVAKAVPISPQRTVCIRAVSDGAEADIVGSKGELVKFAFMSKTGNISVAMATIGDSGKATVRSADAV
eukprot:SAG25_NODE_326_length_9730_cov_8.520195_4_plen_148_part_00